jgi:chemotaxis protein CheD
METQEIYVGIGEGKILKERGILKSIGVGSCVVIILWDSLKKIGGVLHSMLPVPKVKKGEDSPYRYISTGIPKLLEEMEKMGAHRERIVAYIIGGATIFESPFASSPWSIGSRNVLEARNVLSRLKVPVLREEVGGSYGRSVVFDVSKGEIKIKIREREFILG